MKGDSTGLKIITAKMEPSFTKMENTKKLRNGLSTMEILLDWLMIRPQAHRLHFNSRKAGNDLSTNHPTGSTKEQGTVQTHLPHTLVSPRFA